MILAVGEAGNNVVIKAKFNDEPGEDELPAHDALLNWARWCRVRFSQGRAGSAEGRYVTRAGRGSAAVAVGVGVDHLLGDQVNRALLLVATNQRHALQLRYHARMPDAVICRLLSVRPQSYRRFMRDARLLLWAALQTVLSSGISTPH